MLDQSMFDQFNARLVTYRLRQAYGLTKGLYELARSANQNAHASPFSSDEMQRIYNLETAMRHAMEHLDLLEEGED